MPVDVPRRALIPKCKGEESKWMFSFCEFHNYFRFRTICSGLRNQSGSTVVHQNSNSISESTFTKDARVTTCLPARFTSSSASPLLALPPGHHGPRAPTPLRNFAPATAVFQALSRGGTNAQRKASSATPIQLAGCKVITTCQVTITEVSATKIESLQAAIFPNHEKNLYGLKQSVDCPDCTDYSD